MLTFIHINSYYIILTKQRSIEIKQQKSTFNIELQVPETTFGH